MRPEFDVLCNAIDPPSLDAALHATPGIINEGKSDQALQFLHIRCRSLRRCDEARH